MRILKKIYLIDRNSKRRASLCFELSQSNFHIEPFEGIDEFAAKPRNGVVMAYDDGTLLDGLQDLVKAPANDFSIITYCEELAVNEVVAALRNGVLDYIAWPIDVSRLQEALTNAEHRSNTGPKRAAPKVKPDVRMGRLTSRELEVLTGVANGLCNRQIAEFLSISKRTVEVYRANLLLKLDARSSPEAVRIAVECGFVA